MPGGKDESSGQTQKLERSRVHEGGQAMTTYNDFHSPFCVGV